MAHADPIIWLIDDTPHWHQVTKATLERWRTHSFQGFHSGHAGIMAYAHAQPPDLPHMILMDYFIDSERGDHITQALRSHDRGQRPLIIGYSTAASGSRAILAAGGDRVIRKHHNAEGYNPSLLQWLVKGDI